MLPKGPKSAWKPLCCPSPKSALQPSHHPPKETCHLEKRPDRSRQKRAANTERDLLKRDGTTATHSFPRAHTEPHYASQMMKKIAKKLTGKNNEQRHILFQGLIPSRITGMRSCVPRYRRGGAGQSDVCNVCNVRDGCDACNVCIIHAVCHAIKMMQVVVTCVTYATYVPPVTSVTYLWRRAARAAPSAVFVHQATTPVAMDSLKVTQS